MTKVFEINAEHWLLCRSQEIWENVDVLEANPATKNLPGVRNKRQSSDGLAAQKRLHLGRIFAVLDENLFIYLFSDKAKITPVK